MEMTTVKTVAVFAIMFGCFAILYPKIFHPMLLQVLGFGDRGETVDTGTNRIPPHLRRPGAGKTVNTPDDDIGKFMRSGPHPGMRAAAEMKKQAAATQGGGSGKGMMSVVLPMYAVGIVIYLVYTMVKVFGGRKSEQEKGDYLQSHFQDVNYDPKRRRFTQRGAPDGDDNDADDAEDKENEEETISKKFKKGRRDLERLLLKADKNDMMEFPDYSEVIGNFTRQRICKCKKNVVHSYEMHELKRRLMETEAQMARILGALETVEGTVEEVAGPAASKGRSLAKGRAQTQEGEELDGEWVDEEEVVAEGQTKVQPSPSDLSPDMDSYEIVKGKQSQASTPALSPTVEDLGPLEEKLSANARPTQDLQDEEEQEEIVEEFIGKTAAVDDKVAKAEAHPDLRKRVVAQNDEE